MNKDLKTTQEFQLPLHGAWIPSPGQGIQESTYTLCTNQPTNQPNNNNNRKKKETFIIPLVSSGGPRRINCILSLVSSRILSVPDCRKVVRTPYDPLYPPRFFLSKSGKINPKSEFWIQIKFTSDPVCLGWGLWTCLLDAGALICSLPLSSRRTILDSPPHPTW